MIMEITLLIMEKSLKNHGILFLNFCGNPVWDTVLYGKLICAISVCNTLTVGVHLSSSPSISGPGSATGPTWPGKKKVVSVTRDDADQ